MSKAIISVVIGGIVAGAGWIWIVITAFRESRSQGLLSLFPLYAIYYGVKRRSDTMKPLVIALVGIVILIIGIVLGLPGTEVVDNGPAFVSVPSVEEATRLAGYQVSTPTFLPEGFEDTPDEITVEARYTNRPKVVTQIWSVDRDVFLLLVQDPSLDGIGGAEEAVVCGVPGERAYYEATSDRAAVLALYWRIGDMAYSLTGTLKGTLDEETLVKVACSIATN